MISTVFVVSAILQMCLAQQIPPERHSLYYVYTALSKAVNAPGIFEFTAMGLLDDRKIDYYNSVDQVKIPQQDWMREKLAPDYWEKGTQSRKSKEQWFKVNVNILMDRMRQNNSDIHVLMWKHGCEIEKDSSGSFKFFKGMDAYSYDGDDFLSFDETSMQWVAPVTAAVQTKQKWDGVPILNQYTKGYLEKECVDWLEKFRAYGAESLKQVMDVSPPKIHLFANYDQSPGTLKLTCLATDFYPKEIEMTILKGEEVVKTGDVFNVLPNGDGTHQIRLSTEAKQSEINAYRCEVNHIGLGKKFQKHWPSDGEIICSSNCPTFGVGVGLGVGLGVVGMLFLLVILVVVLGVCFGILDRDGYRLRYMGFRSQVPTNTPNGPPSEAVVVAAMRSVDTPLLGNGQTNGSTGQQGNGNADIKIETMRLQDAKDADSGQGSSGDGSSGSSKEDVANGCV